MKNKQDLAWSGAWQRPLHIDEESFDPLTIARMTDHNVRGTSDKLEAALKKLPSDQEGHYDIDGASLVKKETEIKVIIASDIKH